MKIFLSLLTCSILFLNSVAQISNNKVDSLPIIKSKAIGSKYINWFNQPKSTSPMDGWTWRAMCEGPLVEIIKASSNLAPQGKYNYAINNICDDDPRTAWVEGKEDYGIGEYLEFKDWSIMGGGEISILNGYQSSKLAWENNSRVKRFKISLNNKDVCYLDLSDAMGIQTFNLPEVALKIIRGEEKAVKTKEEIPNGIEYNAIMDGMYYYTLGGGGVLRFTIVEVYEGLKFKDTAISGIFSCGG